MKNPIKSIFIMLILPFTFLVSSCSKEDTAPSGTEIIEQGSELTDLMMRTSNNTSNQSIDCIDFIYPLNFFVYNSNNEQTGTQTVNNDSELLTFLLSLAPGDYVELDFPISVVLQDGTVVEVNSNEELTTLILDCASTGNDPVPTDFETLFTSGTWFVTYFFDDTDETSDFGGYEFTFATDGTAMAVNGANAVNGTWNLTNSNTPDLELYFDVNDPFDELDEDWDIIEATNEIIKLKHISGGDGSVDFLTFERTPTTGGGNTGDLELILTDGQWQVGSYLDDGDDETYHYNGYAFTFNANGSATAENGNNTVNGTWDVQSSGSGFDLVLNFEIQNEDDPFDDLNDDWDVQQFTSIQVDLKDVSGGDGSIDLLSFVRL